MIEYVILNRLIADADIQAYCGNNVFAVAAPNGTTDPYIITTVSSTRHEDDVIVLFNIVIEIHDNSADKQLMIAISQKIKELLHFEKLQDHTGRYSNIRIRFNGSEHIKKDEFTHPHLSVQFSARACEELTTDN